MTLHRPLPAVAARLTRTALALPRQRHTNAELLTRVAPQLAGARREAMLAAIEAQLGSLSRHHLDTSEADEGRDGLVHLTTRAVAEVLGASPGIAPRDIAFHVHATSTPSRWTTPESARIGRALAESHGIHAAFFDVRAGCTGGLHAIYQGLRLAADLQAPVLITAADRFSHIAPPNERFAPFVFGDGAAAAIALPGDANAGYALGEAIFAGRAEHADLATVAAELPPRADDTRPWHLTGDPEAFDVAAKTILTALAKHFDVKPDNADVAARVIVSTTRKATATALAGESAYTKALELCGHLGTASLLAGLDYLSREPGLPPSEVILLAAGGGLSAGGARLRWHPGISL